MFKREPYKRYLVPGSAIDIPRSTVKRRKKVCLSDFDSLQSNNLQINQQISDVNNDLCILQESCNSEMNDPSSSRICKESVFHDADEDNDDKCEDDNKDQYDNDEDYDNNNQEFTEENIMKTSAMNVDNTIYFETNVDDILSTSDSGASNLSDTDINDERENSNQSEENLGHHEYSFLEEQLSASTSTTKDEVLFMSLARIASFFTVDSDHRYIENDKRNIWRANNTGY